MAPASSPSPRTSSSHVSRQPCHPLAHISRCLRSSLAPTPGRRSKAEATCRPNEPVTTSEEEGLRTDRTPWAHLLKRVFALDVLTCHKCGGRREVRAFLSSPTLAREALDALGVPFEPLQIAKGHDPPSQESLDLGPGFDGIDPSYPD
jgi:hypothetical protein